ncbi:MAG: beta-lactamase family protein, partial [Lachnospiraceae bacterium]|nr:beta-lactamase family protein [Lachnospiraceae bacterium]
MLMDHTSGIMGTSQIGTFLYDDADTYHHDHLLETLSAQRLKADPGEYAAYCNDGFDLLELIVENVSGESYTDFVSKEVAAPTGGKRTGTALSYVHSKDLVPAYGTGNLLYDNESCMCIGAGGVYSVASDVAEFGASFFKGNDSLLSEDSKEAMSECWNADKDDHMDENGLGWDYVSMLKYEEKGVDVLGKGGDVLLNHAFLMVAPDEEISIAVLSNGGSSMYNGMLAESLMDTILSERGITINDSTTEYTAAGSIPQEYDELAGFYITQNSMEGGAVISKISFPEHKYMHVENISPVNTAVTDYIYTTEGKFAELACEVEDIAADSRIAVNPAVLTFEKAENGSIYIACDSRTTAPGLGVHDRKSYIGEKMSENPVSDETLKAWEEICGKDMLLCNDVASSANYQYGIIRAYMCNEVPGYIFMITGQGSRLLKITDDAHAIAFQTIPSSSNRDIMDVTLKKDGNTISLSTGTGTEYICDDKIPEFHGASDEIKTSGDKAAWYKISDDIAGTSVSLSEMQKDSVIYVYNKYGDVVYTSHVKDAGDEVPMPKGGKIVFLILTLHK